MCFECALILAVGSYILYYLYKLFEGKMSHNFVVKLFTLGFVLSDQSLLLVSINVIDYHNKNGSDEFNLN